MHAPTRTRAVHHPKDLWALCRCGGANGRAILGHMPGSCLHACVHGFSVRTTYALKESLLHSSGMHKQGVFASKASPSSVLINWDRLSLVLRSSFKPRRRRTKHSLCAFWRWNCNSDNQD